MGEAAGRFAYIEDPDGTLIEFVETHKIPIVKKLNFYYDLRKRPIQKPLPSLMLWAMSLMRVK
nr:VOC family protein [Saprospiraceae bacterium]